MGGGQAGRAGPPWAFPTGVIHDHVSRVPWGAETWGTRDKGQRAGHQPIVPRSPKRQGSRLGGGMSRLLAGTVHLGRFPPPRRQSHPRASLSPATAAGLAVPKGVFPFMTCVQTSARRARNGLIPAASLDSPPNRRDTFSGVTSGTLWRATLHLWKRNNRLWAASRPGRLGRMHEAIADMLRRVTLANTGRPFHPLCALTREARENTGSSGPASGGPVALRLVSIPMRSANTASSDALRPGCTRRAVLPRVRRSSRR